MSIVIASHSFWIFCWGVYEHRSYEEICKKILAFSKKTQHKKSNSAVSVLPASKSNIHRIFFKFQEENMEFETVNKKRMVKDCKMSSEWMCGHLPHLTINKNERPVNVPFDHIKPLPIHLCFILSTFNWTFFLAVRFMFVCVCFFKSLCVFNIYYYFFLLSEHQREKNR